MALTRIVESGRESATSSTESEMFSRRCTRDDESSPGLINSRHFAWDGVEDLAGARGVTIGR